MLTPAAPNSGYCRPFLRLSMHRGDSGYARENGTTSWRGSVGWSANCEAYSWEHAVLTARNWVPPKQNQRA